MINIPRVWEILRCFKDECQSRGWNTSEDEDWINLNQQYHNFLWARTIHSSTFEKIATARRCAVRKGVSYQVIDVAYTAWLFPETSPSGELLRMVAESPELSKRTAIYDLSWAYTGKLVCLKLNETDSPVFREFESFLEKKWGVEFRSAKSLVTKEA